MASVDATGAFEFANVTPGEYEVSVTASPPPFAILTHHRSQPVPAPPIPQTEYGRAVVSVQAAGAASVMVSTRPGSSIRGRVTIEGSREGVLPSMFRLTAVAGSVPPALVADNWTFEMRGLSAPTRFLVTSSQPGWWLKAFDVAGVNGADEPVFTVGGVRDATVVLARTSRISGQVVDNGGAVSRCPIIAFPADRARWYDRSQYVKTGISGSDGRFQFEVPPGEYLIVAVDRLQAPGASADFLNVLEPLATRVTIVEVQAVQQDLRLVRVP
jgi:hypothetical protein